MTRRPPTTEIRIDLRTISARVWRRARHGLWMMMAAVDAASAGDVIEVRSGRYEGTQKNQKDITVIQNIGSKSEFWDGIYHKKTKGGDMIKDGVREIL